MDKGERHRGGGGGGGDVVAGSSSRVALDQGDAKGKESDIVNTRRK